MSEVEFPGGLFAKAPHEKAPEYVKAKLSIKREELIAWLQGKDGEWINLEVKENKSGKWYIAVDNWKPKGEQPPATSGEFQDDDLPPF